MTEQDYTVLIVDDHDDTRKNISKLLKFESNIKVVDTASTGKEGIKKARELTPDVVLMDINMPDMDGIKATEAIQEQVPSTQIVILSVQGDTNYMRRAMLAGARDFMTKPAKSDELITVIKRAGQKAKEEKEKAAFTVPGQAGVRTKYGTTSQLSGFGKAISVYSPKGGVGKTTIATNLAVTLHRDETPVVIVDGNLQFGDVAVFMNERSKNSIVDLTPMADQLDPEVVEEVAIHHKSSGVDIISAPPHPEDADTVTGPQLVKVLEYLKRLYTYVIVDTATGLSDITLDTLDASDLVILVTAQEIPSIINSRMMLALLRALNISKEKIVMVMNRFEKQISISPEKVSKNLNHKIVAVIPEDPQIVMPAVNRGVPFMLDDVKSKEIGKGILRLSAQVRESLNELENEIITEN
ncbi:MAG: response regulator [Anaerolineales bacterium]